jgi:hypothetical protein
VFGWRWFYDGIIFECVSVSYGRISGFGGSGQDWDVGGIWDQCGAREWDFVVVFEAQSVGIVFG